MKISEIYSVERGPQPLSISKFRKKVIAGKMSGPPDMNFGLGDLTPKGGSKPQLMGAVVRDLKGARSSERTAAISVAVAEKTEFEK